MGFTIIGEGYLNFGYIGVVLWAIMLGLLVKKLYFSSKRSLTWLVIYVISIPTFIYSSRADLSNITSPLIKQTIIPLAILYVVNKIMTSQSKT